MKENSKNSIREYGSRLVCIALCCLLGALMIEALTLFGAPFASVFDFNAWSTTRIVITWIALLVLSGFIAQRSQSHRRGGRKTELIRLLKGVCCALLPSICILLSLLAARYIISIDLLTVPTIGIIAAVIFAALCVVSLRSYLSDKPENIYLPVGIAFALVFCLLVPVDTSVSWDDQIHYDRAVAISYLFSPEYTEADRVMLNPDPSLAGGYSAPSEGYISYLCSLEQLSKIEFEKCVGPVSSLGFNTLSYQAIGYLPMAFGLWLSRLLHLSFVATFLLGRLFNAVFFMALVYLGMSRLRVGKAVVIVFSLLPTVVFLSASYSYDPWCIGWLLYGFLRYISWHQHPSFKMSGREAVIVISAFALGCGPKAIYFPIFFILLFVPHSFFASKKQMNGYRTAVVGISIAVLATFLAPFLYNGPGSGDDRGGSDVNSTAQVSWILANPISYVYVIASFLKDYLSPASSSGYTDVIVYLSPASLRSFPLAALLIFAVVDNGGATHLYSGWRYKVAAALLLVGTTALISTALYISFTPVAHYTVNGCTARYLLPIIAPILILGFNLKSVYGGSRTVLNGAAFSAAIAFNAWACFHSIVHVYA